MRMIMIIMAVLMMRLFAILLSNETASYILAVRLVYKVIHSGGGTCRSLEEGGCCPAQIRGPPFSKEDMW